ncbi:ankyrin repeat domain-containing protein [Streptomyces sp. NPDC089915]|uniref:ankyrin repeat domain-containing protein n=1 Tax=Streptomyces sp. NPDC089915 TaxID=3155186 RepID=UPI003444D8EC
MNPHDRLLLDAAKAGDTDGVRAALAAGAAPETRDEDLRTPLLLASLGDHVGAAEVLVAAGADPDAPDSREDTAWLVTGVTGSVRMMRTLLPAGPDLTRRNRFGGISVIPAAERGHVAYVRAVLAETDIDVDHVNRLGWTALLEAVILGDGGSRHEEVVRLLLAAGADPRLADAEGVTAYEHAVRRGFDGLVRLLRAAQERPGGDGDVDGGGVR